MGPANIEMRVYTDRAELFPISIGMYGGTLQISSRVDRSTDPPRFTANVQMRNLDVAKVLDVTPSARGKMGGTGELDLQLLGNLSDAWKKTLSGTGKFAVRNGHLPGVNLATRRSRWRNWPESAETRRSRFSKAISISPNQRVSSKQIHLDSPSGIVDLSGSVGLDSTLDYQGTVTLNPAAALGSSGVGGVRGRTDRQPRRENYRAVRACGERSRARKCSRAKASRVSGRRSSASVRRLLQASLRRRKIRWIPSRVCSRNIDALGSETLLWSSPSGRHCRFELMLA